VSNATERRETRFVVPSTTSFINLVVSEFRYYISASICTNIFKSGPEIGWPYGQYWP